MSELNEIIPNHVKEAANAIFSKGKDKTGGVAAEAIRIVISDTDTDIDTTEYEFWGNFTAGDVSLLLIAKRSVFPFLRIYHEERAEAPAVPVGIFDIEAGTTEKTYVYGKFKVKRIPLFFMSIPEKREAFVEGVESFKIGTGAARPWGTHIVSGKFSVESLGFLGKPVHVNGAAEGMVAKGKEISEGDDGGMMVEFSDTGAVVAQEKYTETFWFRRILCRLILLEEAIGKTAKEKSEADVIGDYVTKAGLAPENVCWGEVLDREFDRFDFEKPVQSVWEKIRLSNPQGLCFPKLAEMSIGISGQAILTLTGNAASTGSEHSREFKIIALANGVGFTSALISTLYKNKYSALLGKLGVVCASFGLIGSMAVQLDVGKGCMWGITGVLSLIPAIAVSLA